MIQLFIYTCFILQTTANENKEMIIFQDGVFSNGYQVIQSTGYVSTTAEYKNEVVIYIMLSQNGYLNIQTDNPMNLQDYKYLEFELIWDQLGITPQLEIGIGEDKDSMRRIPVSSSLKVNNKNKVIVDISSLTINSTNDKILRIYKMDKADCNLYFNNIKLTEVKGQSGVYTFSDQLIDGSMFTSILLFVVLFIIMMV